MAEADTRFAWRVGFLLGLPIAVPAPPLYVFGFACFFVALLRRRPRPPGAGIGRELGMVALIALALVSNVAGLTRNNIDAVRIITTSFFFLLFLFPDCIADKRALLLGFCRAMLIWAVLVIAMAFYLRIWDNGLLLFSVPDFRLWGSGIFPDWPNYMAFMLALAFLLNATMFGRPWQAALLLVAAVLTTSRTPLIALALFLAASLLLQLARLRLGTLLAFGGAALLLAVLLPLLQVVEVDTNFLDRLLVFDDRDDIYSFALGLVQQSPWVGYGGVLLDESIGFTGHPSFHNSYLDIAVRHGLPALAIFLLLLVPPRGSWRSGGLRFAAVVVFVLAGSMFQNFLKHPHILMLYAVLIEASPLFRGPRREP
ncbi:hypothetical protein IP87_12415 [beta proteobacterium AAP121]|nr:hypothetical protein IP80_09680 [beta proteobacterium AAP65]KPF97177.1 hypothetical protein IP87_12415 [beta proteobacterium AAP121]